MIQGNIWFDPIKKQTATLHELVEWQVRPNGITIMTMNHYIDNDAYIAGSVVEQDFSVIQRPTGMYPVSAEFGDPANNAWKDACELSLVNNINVIQPRHEYKGMDFIARV